MLDTTRTGLVEPGATYDDVLNAVRKALLGGRLGEAESLLMTAGTITDSDPAFLNLAGIVHEAHGRPDSANRFYRKALTADSAYEPAEHNLKRLGEILKTGNSEMRVDLGEHAPILQHNV